MRKIGPELTSTNPPLFAEEDWSWANNCAHLPPHYMGCRHNMARQAVHWCAPGIQTSEPGAAVAERAHLTAAPPGWPLSLFLKLKCLNLSLG